MIGWDEILEGGLAPNATVMSWRGEAGGIEAARQQHNVIMTPNTYLYFDYYQAKDTDSEPLAIGGYLPMERVYSYEPMPSALSPEEQKFITGVQANLWTEYIPTMAQALVLCHGWYGQLGQPGRRPGAAHRYLTAGLQRLGWHICHCRWGNFGGGLGSSLCSNLGCRWGGGSFCRGWGRFCGCLGFAGFGFH